MFEEVAKSDLEGMIFTRVWAFDLGEKEEEYYNNIKKRDKIWLKIYV